ncbi:MAG: hypothetical protein K8I27_14870 [Planctomycetes bacterium]|nr:hypothetical protein [Planctomycetota bacterium]
MPIIWTEPETYFREHLPEQALVNSGGAMIGTIHRYLAALDARHRFPLLPKSEACNMDHWTGEYWSGALHLFTLLLGWTNPGRGLLEIVDGRLKLNESEAAWRAWHELYEPYADLDLLIAWAIHPANIGCCLPRQLAFGGTQPWSAGAPEPSSQWREQFKRKYPNGGSEYFSPMGPADPNYGSSPNELHLDKCTVWATDEQAALQSTKGATVLTDLATRKAAVILDHLKGWYAALCEVGKALPDLGERSWHVELFVRNTGLIGTFRRSRETGLWFTGRHSIHMAGQ